MAARDDEALDAALAEALDSESPEAMEETLLQSYLFVGYPLALGALARWRRMRGGPPPEPREEDWEAWRRRGARVLRAVYGEQHEALRRNVRHLHPEMERWMVTEGYGKVLGREGLSLVERELNVVALLTVLRTPVQLYSHLRGALAVGARAENVEEVLGEACDFLEPPGREEAWKTWKRVMERKERPGPPAGGFRRAHGDGRDDGDQRRS